MEHNCKYCSRSFDSDTKLRTHMRRCTKDPDFKHFICEECKKSFTRKETLAEHLKVHESSFQKERSHCMVPKCNYLYFFKTELINHLKNEHNTPIQDKEELVFPCMEKFKKWKEDIEEKTHTYYSKQYGGRKRDTYTYYYCQHDGKSKVHTNCSNNSKHKKPPNSKGKVKTGKLCLSMIKVKKEDNNSSVYVIFYPSHNHPVEISDLKHQPLNKTTNTYINNMIRLGVSPRKIMKKLKGYKFSRVNRSSEVSYSRNDFLLLKSLRERKRVLFNTTNSLAPDDGNSTRLLVENLRMETFDPVLIFKELGSQGSASVIDDEVFMLGIQTKEQSDMMKRCAQDILVIDATHDMTQYGCQLLNIMGIDEFNRGYALAHCVSNKMDANTLQHFFHAIKRKHPTLKVNCIITDDDPSLINAANLGFDQGPIKHILCLWHFKRTLQRNLHSKVRNTSLETEMFKYLCTIVDATSETNFKSLVKGFLGKYKDSSEASSFIDYFNDVCMPKVEKWAMFARHFPHKKVETTMYVESFHNVLKSIYLRRKPNRRIDTLINLLLEVEEDTYVRWNVSNIKNEQEILSELITDSHSKSITFPVENITSISENVHWKVKSETNDDVMYDIHRCASVCDNPDWCFFKCPLCQGLCSHMYICTCPNSSPLCKHIHKIHADCINNGLQEVPEPLQSVAEPIFYTPVMLTPHPSSNAEESSIVSAPEPSQQSMKKLKKISSELMERIDKGQIPQILIPHITGVLSQLLAECHSVGSIDNNNNNAGSMSSKMVPTQKRSSTEKLTCQVLPKKKKRQCKKSIQPTAAEKKCILNSVQVEEEEEEEDTDSELNDLIEEYFDED